MYALHSLVLTEEEKKSVRQTLDILHAISGTFCRKEYVNAHTGEVSNLTRIDDAISLLCGVVDGFTDCTDEDAICEWFNTPKEYNNFVISRANFYTACVENGLLAEKKPKHEECEEYDIEDCDFFSTEDCDLFDINLELK